MPSVRTYLFPFFAILLALSTSSCSKSDERGLVQIRWAKPPFEQGKPIFHVPATQDSVQLGKLLFDLSHIQQAEVVKQPERDGYDVWAKLTEGAAKNLSVITRGSIGRRLAVVVDGELTMAPRITARIDLGKVMLYYDLPQSEAEEKVAMLNAAL